MYLQNNYETLAPEAEHTNYFLYMLILTFLFRSSVFKKTLD